MNSDLPLVKRVTPPALLALLVAVVAAIPLLSNRWFYFWDDSAAAFAPGWHTIGERLLDGSWPTLFPEMWAGGNITAEALYGTYNPVLLAQAVLVAVVPNLAVGMTLVKMQFLALLAVGVYVLARQYGAARSMAFVAGFAMPFAGYTLYFDASTWVSGLIAFAWIPHVWWSTRASAMGRVNPLVPIVLGVLAMTTGNPYGAVAVAVVYLAVIAETVARNRAADAERPFPGIRSLLVSGAAIVMMSLIVYLPLVFTTGVSVRTQTGIRNDDALRPGLGDLLNLSALSNRPYGPIFDSTAATVPLVYLVWFLVPLAPWIRWGSLRRLGPSTVSLAVFGGIYLLLLLGPSNLWLFRWPARLIEYGQLPVIVIAAAALSAGLARDRWRMRLGITAALIVAQFYLSWAEIPEDVGIHLAALAISVALTAVALLVSFRKPRLLAGALVAGTVVALAAQTNLWFTGNYNVTPWKFPRQESFLEEHFEERYPGTTFVIADSKNIDPTDPTGQWGDVLFGSLYQSAGVEAVNNYAGISFNSFVDDLCINYYGGVPCGDGVGRLLAESPGTGVPWIDAMRIDTVVVQNSGPYGGPNALDALPADQWDVHVEHGVTVGTRTRPYPWPDGRVSAVTPGLEITGDSASTDTHETVTYTGSGTATFALLAWPGWTATVNGEPVDVIESPGGLLQLQLPDSGDAESTLTLQFTPPANGLGWGLAGVGLVLALGQGAWFVVRKRRTHRPTILAGNVS
ncbi:YfhO family protein [Prescottella equi]|uniref:hypothetical protein n=1 Tax=Rhodococcus hoagii TaxID=43767 RepID=UPI000A10BE59|nr:hypothetical protein [Prescottella equi]ORL96389.1 hypothetical protein A5N69_13850 [Prescottella equi]ORM15774.1 hypothetical protein A5N74_18170 [Prescottella equi]QDP11957.1 YfhO family protein [Prescottella equi]